MKHLLKIILLIGISFVSQCQLSAQPSITWQRTYGDYNIDYGYSIVQTPDEGYIAVGRKTDVYNNNYLFAMRLSKYGDTIWIRTYLGFAAYQIEKLSDGDYLINSYLFDPVIKIDINGNTIWSKNNFGGGSLKSSLDSGFFLDKNLTASKYDNNGDLIWSYDYSKIIKGGEVRDFAIRPDNSLLYIGVGDSIPGSNTFILRIDKNGKFVSINWFNSEGVSKIISIDNNYFAGTGVHNGAFLNKMDTLGNVVWRRSYDSGLPEFMETRSLIRTNDKGFAFAGYYDNGNYDDYMRLLKTDSSGNEQFRELYGFHNNDQAFNLRQTSDSGYVLIGIRDNFNLGDIYIVKTDKSGYANPPVSIANNSEIFPGGFELFQNFPNPFNPITKIRYYIPRSQIVEIKIYNSLGMEVKTIFKSKVDPGNHEIDFDASNLSSGIYYCQLESSDYIKSIKMLLIK